MPQPKSGGKAHTPCALPHMVLPHLLRGCSNLPNKKDIKEGVIAYKIAVHAEDLANGHLDV
jgi:hypothetical protein